MEVACVDTRKLQAARYSRFSVRTHGTTKVNFGIDLSGDLSFLDLVRNASLVVQIVPGLLLLVSIISWWYIFFKLFALEPASSDGRVSRRNSGAAAI